MFSNDHSAFPAFLFSLFHSSEMKIDAVLSPPEIDLLPQRDLGNTTCVIFDVLRATSSMITALGNGAKEIYPVRTIEEALALKAKLPGALLGGERHGDLIEGFDLGNSPLEYRASKAARIITTTTNGTVALRACEHAREVLAGALLNMDALRVYLQQRAPENLLLVCAGTFRELALEDVLAAGMLCQSDAELTDAARVARSVFGQHRHHILQSLRESRNGRVLLAKDRDEELRWCAQLSLYDAVGVMKNGVIRRGLIPLNAMI